MKEEKNNKSKMVLLVIAVLVLLIGVSVISYNSLVNAQAEVGEQQSNIKTQLQRRSDLIPNLVQTVKNFSNHESEIFDQVAKSREAMMQAKSMGEMAEANEEVSSALSQLTAVAEAYPELKSDSVYVGLMDELAGTENRIAVARKDYNSAVNVYNKKIRQFPSSLFAGMFGFEKADYFEAAQGVEKVPEVEDFSK